MTNIVVDMGCLHIPKSDNKLPHSGNIFERLIKSMSCDMKSVQTRTCHTCKKTFSKAEHLTRHLRSHTKERPYECSVCGRLYSRR